MSDFARTLGDRIRQVRGAMSQADFGAKIGVNKNLLGKYERGESVPGGEILGQISEKTGISIDWLLTGNGQMLRNQAMHDPASIPEAAQAQAVEAIFYGQVLEHVAAVYHECGVTPSLAQLGAEAAEIVADLSSPDFPTLAAKTIGLKGISNALRRRLQSANDHSGGTAHGKQSA